MPDDREYALAITNLQQMIAMFVYFNRSDKPEYRCLDDLKWLYRMAREPMYDYDEKVRDKFFFNSAFAFLFTWFAKSPSGKEFTKSQFQKKNEKYVHLTMKRIEELGDIAWSTFKACNVSKQKQSDKRHVLKAEESLARSLKLTKAERIQKAEAKLAYARQTKRSNKNKETALELKARSKLERLIQNFDEEKKQSIAKKRLNVQEEKKVLKMRQVLAKALAPQLENQIRQNWLIFSTSVPL